MATANTIHVDIVSAEGEIFAGAASMVFAPGAQGELGIAPRHAPLLTLLKAGEVRVQTPDGAEQHFFVGGGALEIQPNKVTVLADTALRAKDLGAAFIGGCCGTTPEHVRAMREALGSGRHTTTHAELYRLDATSAIIDSPGLQEFGLAHVPAAEAAHAAGLGIHAGHDLDLANLSLFRTLPHLAEVSIGHALISRALWVGLERTVRDYLQVTDTTGQWSAGIISSNILVASSRLQRVTNRQWEPATETKVFSTEGVASGKRPSRRITIPSRKQAASRIKFGMTRGPGAPADRLVRAPAPNRKACRAKRRAAHPR